MRLVRDQIDPTETRHWAGLNGDQSFSTTRDRSEALLAVLDRQGEASPLDYVSYECLRDLLGDVLAKSLHMPTVGARSMAANLFGRSTAGLHLVRNVGGRRVVFLEEARLLASRVLAEIRALPAPASSSAQVAALQRVVDRHQNAAAGR